MALNLLGDTVGLLSNPFMNAGYANQLLGSTLVNPLSIIGDSLGLQTKHEVFNGIISNDYATYNRVVTTHQAPSGAAALDRPECTDGTDHDFVKFAGPGYDFNIFRPEYLPHATREAFQTSSIRSAFVIVKANTGGGANTSAGAWTDNSGFIVQTTSLVSTENGDQFCSADALDFAPANGQTDPPMYPPSAFMAFASPEGPAVPTSKAVLYIGERPDPHCFPELKGLESNMIKVDRESSLVAVGATDPATECAAFNFAGSADGFGTQEADYSFSGGFSGMEVNYPTTPANLDEITTRIDETGYTSLIRWYTQAEADVNVYGGGFSVDLASITPPNPAPTPGFSLFSPLEPVFPGFRRGKHGEFCKSIRVDCGGASTNQNLRAQAGRRAFCQGPPAGALHFAF